MVPVRVYSIYRDGRLAAVVRSGKGPYQRAGAQGTQIVAEVPFANLTSFGPQQEQAIAVLIGKARGLDDFLFKLKLEGFELRDGEPNYDLPYGRW